MYLDSFVALVVDVQPFHDHLLKSLLLLHCIAFSHLSKITELYLMWVHIWALCSVHLFVCSFYQYYTVLIMVVL